MNAHPVRTLTLWFWSWKLLLLLIVLVSPGPGYDTSTSILAPISRLQLPSSLLKFVRWDSIYFVNIAQRGYLYEQEWAFGYGYVLSILSAGTPRGTLNVALAGIVVSHLCHYLSVLLLYRLTRTVFEKGRYNSNLPLLSAALHIISPAGVFLSAPYGEAPFSFVNFLGFYIYVLALKHDREGALLRRDVEFVVAGCVFAVATTVRSNGILGGILFAYDALSGALEVVQTRNLKVSTLRRLVFVVIGGAVIPLGTVGPQYFAYSAYCQSSTSPRSWCFKTIPSIYTWVQSHYWNVGFLSYWTISNIPLFVLAAPMLLILSYSSRWALTTSEYSTTIATGDSRVPVDRGHAQACLVRLALPQAILAVLALTSYHVQIITRQASAYPLWYLWLASCLLREGKRGRGESCFVKPGHLLHGMVLYGVIQASLFASFLPPA